MAADHQIWGLAADIDITDDVSLDLTYDNFHDGEATNDFYDQPVGGRKKRKGTAPVSKQINDYWKASFGATYLELSNPLATTSNKSGYIGSRLDAGARPEYAPDADQTYYGFDQATPIAIWRHRARRPPRCRTEYRLIERIGLEREISCGRTGVGENFKIGVGYNFGNFSDDLRESPPQRSWRFPQLIGKF